MEEEEDENIDNVENKEGIISESDLLDLYDFQYNDLFSKILKKNEEKFFALLQEQVLLNLRIINKLSDLSLMSYFQDFILERYKTDKKKITNDIEEIKKLQEKDIVYLDYSNCYIHCHKNLNAFHKCLNKLILYKGFIYCLQCNKVYNENQIKLYCSECDEIYFSKLRKNVDESNVFFFPVVFMKNHCQTEYDYEEKIKCLECGEDLYFDLSKIKEEKEKYKYKRIPDSIKELLCTNCKLIYDTREIKFTCSECENDFMSDAKIYNDFPLYKRKILYLVHTLRKEKLAIPENFNGKKCNCDVTLMKEFFHEEDNGVLLEGYKDEKNKIICKQCFEIYEGDKYEWKCPSCGEKFKVVKPKENIIKARSRSRSNKYIKTDKRNNEIKNEIKDDNKNINNIKGENKININEIKDDAKEEDEKKINLKKEIEKNYNSEDNNKTVKIENLLDEENANDNNLKNEEFKENKNQERNENNINNNRNIIISKYNNNKYNKQNNKINNNFRNYNQNNNENDKYNYRKINNQNKEEENKNNSKKDVKEMYKNVSTKVIIDTKNYNNNNSISKKRNIETQKRKDNINNRNKNKISIYNIRHNHQIININETSKRDHKNRNSAIIEQSKKEIQQKEIIDNKENKEKETKKNMEEFNNIKKYFEDFNEELEKDIEIKNNLRKLNKEKKEKEFVSNKNLRINVNVDYKNHAKHNVSNMHNINNIHNIYHFSNKGINGSKKNNYQYTDNNFNNNIQKYKRQPNGSRENIKEKKDTKKNFSSNKIVRKDVSQNTSRRRNNNVINIKVGHYNKDNNENNYNKQKQNIQNNDKNERNNNKIYNKYDIYKNNNNNINNKKEEVKDEKEIKNEIKQEPALKNEQNTYTQININSDNYKNIRILGQGSYGKIYLVENTNTKEQFAMKKLILGDKLELRDNQDEYNMIMQITSSYPELNIIHVYGTETKNFDEYNFVFYVLMEVANCDWEKELLNRSRHKAFYTEDEIFYILQSLVDTFAYLQEIGICHRDIKPQNILCFGEKGYKISDFGEAKYRKKWRLQQQSVDYTSMQTVRGTELYMSPILYTALKTAPNKGANHNVFKSDVFSLGMCFLFAACLDYKSLYDIRKVNGMNKLRDVVNQYVNGRYSNDFMNILFSMLQINEKERPDFIELSSMV